jgi:hypothetical protein
MMLSRKPERASAAGGSTPSLTRLIMMVTAGEAVRCHAVVAHEWTLSDARS